MTAVLSVVFAVCAAISNAMGTVLQRRAALIVPRSQGFRLGLMWDLLRTPVWLFGILGVIFAAAFQGLALATGPLAVVQPIFVLELPAALMIGGMVFHRRMPTLAWIWVACLVGGLGMALVAAAPTGGSLQPGVGLWVLALASCGGAMVVLCLAALRRPVGGARAVCLGLAAAIGYALTAALMKSATDTLDHQGVEAFFTSWQTYGFATVGVCALFLLENAMQAGPLVASQPALTLGDALVSLSLGVTLYNETVRVGWWLIPQIIGVLLVALGAIGLSRLQMQPQEGDAQGRNGGQDPVPGSGASPSSRFRPSEGGRHGGSPARTAAPPKG
ncbi:DMT family transporter [Streptacidiphilus anmyonensis]|uniref:DMT family transporter n=1 Tax=Streptacidiphilus anmyonensis TaxID=405782 RepID=UPI0007C86A7C|nr:DMT family transporter [Streptacidiphilus anmyonensis]